MGGIAPGYCRIPIFLSTSRVIFPHPQKKTEPAVEQDEVVEKTEPAVEIEPTCNYLGKLCY